MELIASGMDQDLSVDLEVSKLSTTAKITSNKIVDLLYVFHVITNLTLAMFNRSLHCAHEILLLLIALKLDSIDLIQLNNRYIIREGALAESGWLDLLMVELKFIIDCEEFLCLQ